MIIRHALDFLPRKSSNRLTVMSLNTWMIPGRSRDIEQRWGKIVKMVLDYSPDILLLQEVWTEEMKAWARGLLHPYFEYIVAPEEDAKLVRGRYGSGLIMFSNLKVHHEEFFIFTGKARTFLENVLRRGYHLMQMRWLGKPLTIVNTHLTSYGQYEDIRMEQLYILNERLKKEKGPVLVAGDFNLVPDSQAYRYFTNECGWSDLAGSNEYTWVESNPYYDQSEPDSRLDYFFGKGLARSRYEVLQTIYSDHLAIYIQVYPLAAKTAWQRVKEQVSSIFSSDSAPDPDLPQVNTDPEKKEIRL